MTLKWTLLSSRRCFIGILHSDERLTRPRGARPSQWRARSGDVIQQLWWKRQQPADYWQPSVLDPCSTSSQTSCSYSRRNPNHRRIPLQTESGTERESKKSASCAVWPPSLHIYINSRGHSEEERKVFTAHECQETNELSIMKERRCFFSQKQTQILLIMIYRHSFMAEKGPMRSRALQYDGILTVCVFY